MTLPQMLVPGLMITLCMIASNLAIAQTFPSKPVRIVVPFPAGILDTVARLLATRLSDSWGQPVIVENKPGAGGNIGADYVARAAGDGTTFLMGGTSLIINVPLHKRVPYTLMKDLLPVTLVARLPFVVVVNPSVPATNLQELISYARANPGKLNFGSGGNGTVPHVSGELFKLKAQVDMVHIPFKGAAATVTELLAGRIDLAIDTATPYLQFIQRGDLRPLAVPAASRLSNLPNVPTTKEAGLDGFETGAWVSLWAPGGTSPSIIQQVSRDVAAVTASPGIREEWAKLGIQAAGTTPEEFTAFVDSELNKWTEVVRVSGAKVD
jgi:tripartite-type tricarboxylate transporter receptor subunit TctC